MPSANSKLPARQVKELESLLLDVLSIPSFVEFSTWHETVFHEVTEFLDRHFSASLDGHTFYEFSMPIRELFCTGVEERNRVARELVVACRDLNRRLHARRIHDMFPCYDIMPELGAHINALFDRGDYPGAVTVLEVVMRHYRNLKGYRPESNHALNCILCFLEHVALTKSRMDGVWALSESIAAELESTGYIVYQRTGGRQPQSPPT